MLAVFFVVETTSRLARTGQFDDACRQLRDAYERCDGDPRPPEFVAGEAASELAAMILEVMSAQGCSE